MPPESVININEATLITAIDAAAQRVVFVAPGITEPLALAIGRAWSRLPGDAVSVVLDVDPEICRLGYGTIEGLRGLEKIAAGHGALVCHHQQGVRIGLLVADGTTMVYSPTPLLVENDKRPSNQPNGVCLRTVPTEIAADLGLTVEGVAPENRTIGLDAVKPAAVERVSQDLKRNPPQRFDLARKVRVFNSRFEFVELSLQGCYISRKTASIPSELMGLAKDENMKARLKSTFKVIGSEDVFKVDPKPAEKKSGNAQPELIPPTVSKAAPGPPHSERQLTDERKKIEEEFLCHIRGYGTAILRENKDAFKTRVTELQAKVEVFKTAVRTRLKEIIECNQATLVEALFPAIKQSYPARWKKFLGQSPDENALRRQLKSEIAQAFGNPERLLQDMKVEAVFKAVTYESLQSEAFIKAAKAAFPNLDVFHEEFDAARSNPKAS